MTTPNATSKKTRLKYKQRSAKQNIVFGIRIVIHTRPKTLSLQFVFMLYDFFDNDLEFKLHLLPVFVGFFFFFYTIK